MPGFIGFPELLLLGLVVLLVFGPKRLPEMGRSLGRGMREFKSSVTGEHEDRFTVPQDEHVVAIATEPAVAPHEQVVAVTHEPVVPVREREVA